ncbi:hypothetical protein EJ06DRAFT_526402 [Trichodelitschia bisporula]|uniref:Uncharacterized protein n=1 Tax=Trichodelitschia bisporula TaxID=703511 RepID=A0A6G1I801_9PEZI|nr:hypothetical protein EJ06DRAFT_526402 [Trichodelitschia bisporula]
MQPRMLSPVPEEQDAASFYSPQVSHASSAEYAPQDSNMPTPQIASANVDQDPNMGAPQFQRHFLSQGFDPRQFSRYYIPADNPFTQMVANQAVNQFAQQVANHVVNLYAQQVANQGGPPVNHAAAFAAQTYALGYNAALQSVGQVNGNSAWMGLDVNNAGMNFAPGSSVASGFQTPDFSPYPGSGATTPGLGPDSGVGVLTPSFVPAPGLGVPASGFAPAPISGVPNPGFASGPISGIPNPGLPSAPSSSIPYPGFARATGLGVSGAGFNLGAPGFTSTVQGQSNQDAEQRNGNGAEQSGMQSSEPSSEGRSQQYSQTAPQHSGQGRKRAKRGRRNTSDGVISRDLTGI